MFAAYVVLSLESQFAFQHSLFTWKVYCLVANYQLLLVTLPWKFLKITQQLTATFIPHINTLRTGDADLRFYITTVQDG